MPLVRLGSERVRVFYDCLEFLAKRREIVFAAFLGKLFVYGRRARDGGRGCPTDDRCGRRVWIS